MRNTQSEYSFLTSYLPPKPKIITRLCLIVCLASFLGGTGSFLAYQAYDQNRPVNLKQMQVLSGLVSTEALNKNITRQDIWIMLASEIGIDRPQHMKRRDFNRARYILMMRE